MRLQPASGLLSKVSPRQCQQEQVVSGFALSQSCTESWCRAWAAAFMLDAGAPLPSSMKPGLTGPTPLRSARCPLPCQEAMLAREGLCCSWKPA